MSTKPTIVKAHDKVAAGNDNPAAKTPYSMPEGMGHNDTSLTAMHGTHKPTILNKVVRTCPNCGKTLSMTHQCN